MLKCPRLALARTSVGSGSKAAISTKTKRIVPPSKLNKHNGDGYPSHSPKSRHHDPTAYLVKPGTKGFDPTNLNQDRHYMRAAAASKRYENIKFVDDGKKPYNVHEEAEKVMKKRFSSPRRKYFMSAEEGKAAMDGATSQNGRKANTTATTVRKAGRKSTSEVTKKQLPKNAKPIAHRQKEFIIPKALRKKDSTPKPVAKSPKKNPAPEEVKVLKKRGRPPYIVIKKVRVVPPLTPESVIFQEYLHEAESQKAAATVLARQVRMSNKEERASLLGDDKRLICSSSKLPLNGYCRNITAQLVTFWAPSKSAHKALTSLVVVGKSEYEHRTGSQLDVDKRISQNDRKGPDLISRGIKKVLKAHAAPTLQLHQGKFPEGTEQNRYLLTRLRITCDLKIELGQSKTGNSTNIGLCRASIGESYIRVMSAIYLKNKTKEQEVGLLVALDEAATTVETVVSAVRDQALANMKPPIKDTKLSKDANKSPMGLNVEQRLGTRVPFMDGMGYEARYDKENKLLHFDLFPRSFRTSAVNNDTTKSHRYSGAALTASRRARILARCNTARSSMKHPYGMSMIAMVPVDRNLDRPRFASFFGLMPDDPLVTSFLGKAGSLTPLTANEEAAQGKSLLADKLRAEEHELRHKLWCQYIEKYKPLEAFGESDVARVVKRVANLLDQDLPLEVKTGPGRKKVTKTHAGNDAFGHVCALALRSLNEQVGNDFQMLYELEQLHRHQKDTQNKTHPAAVSALYVNGLSPSSKLAAPLLQLPDDSLESPTYKKLSSWVEQEASKQMLKK